MYVLLQVCPMWGTAG